MIFAVIAYGVVVVSIPAAPGGNVGTLLPIFLGLAALFAVKSFVVKLVLRSVLSKSTPNSALLVPNIVAFALSEAVALLGLVLHFVGATLPQSLGFFGGGLLLLALHFPMPAPS